MLLMFGADPLARNEEGKLASDFAREAGHDRLAQRLIDLETKLATP
jgi:ankyrin repeat protein